MAALLSPRVIAPALIALLTACSLVSGWSDLQTDNGKSSRDASDDQPAVRTPPSGDDEDATATPDTGTTIPSSSVDCSGTACSTTTGCCDDGDTRRCQTETQCGDNGGTWIQCDSQATCAAEGKVCCYHQTRDTVTCQARCDTAIEVRICTRGERCPNGTPCVPGTAGAARDLGSCF